MSLTQGRDRGGADARSIWRFGLFGYQGFIKNCQPLGYWLGG